MTIRSSLYLVVEGPTDAHLIRAILRKDLARQLRFFAGGDGISLATLGRNILVHEGGPVLLAMDSNTRNQDLVNERQSLAVIALSSVVQPGFPGSSELVKVFAFVPEIEVIFFEAPQSLELLLGKEVPQEKVQEGLLAPKATLAKMLDKGKVNYQTLVTSMSPQVASILASARQAQALKATIESMLAPAVQV